MNKLKTTTIAACALVLCGATLPAYAQDTQDNGDKSATATDNAVDTDNTRVNARDRNEKEPTADQAENNAPDREIMQKIRKAIVEDKSLSTYAHNIKIISENGKVTLKGPVRNKAEREKILKNAARIAGKDNVTDELTVESNSKHD